MADQLSNILTVNRARIQNAGFTGPGGGLGAGDRGAYGYQPAFTGNPHDSNDYMFKWRQYVHLYETSWEARKIVRIIPEDALRKDWIIEDIPEQKAKHIEGVLNRLRFTQVLKRSLILERLLGGCLTFLGLEGETDETATEFKPSSGAALRFCNAIPLSRIQRMEWDTNPLSAHYMRPGAYTINGEQVHVSRCLVWDGEPLFDPYDFALTNFRGNLAGFGPSVLAAIWDDIVKAVGTRQAAYQLIQTNNAILMAVNDLQDLAGTKSGQEALRKVKQIAQQISVYNAAIIDGDKVEVKQHSASFGSVPELILTFIQILSAASDIPATRFLGQAPGGLNATGDSDLENYYNVIDAYQRQRIEPNVRRVYDIIGFNSYGQEWKKDREKLTFKFPPLWNATELEEAEKHSKTIDNAMKLFDAGLMDERKVIKEINAKGALSVALDETDISTVGDTGLGTGMATGEKVDPQQELSRLRNSVYFRNADSTSMLIKAAGGDPEIVDRAQFTLGLKEEQEHADTVDGDQLTVAKIVLDHLKEDVEYYTKLEKVMNSVGTTLGALRRSQWAKKDTIYLDLSFTDREKLLEKLILSLPAGARRLAALQNEVTAIAGTHAGVDVTQRLLNGMSVMYPNKVQVSFTLGLDEVILGGKNWRKQNSISFEALPEPTAKQASAGNYKKHPLKLHGLHFSIENPQGSTRRGTAPDGTEWESTLPAHYGYIKKTEGADGDHVDAYVGPHEESELVFVIDQNNLDGEFDEHKCIFGALSTTQAKELYLAGFGDGSGSSRLRALTPMHVSQFTQWLREGDTKSPFSK